MNDLSDMETPTSHNFMTTHRWSKCCWLSPCHVSWSGNDHFL